MDMDHNHVTPLTHFNSSPQMAQISPPPPIFISTEGRANQIEHLYRTARRLQATRRNFARFHWPTMQAAPHPRHPVQAPLAPPHQTPLPIHPHAASGYSGILLNFL